jgi:hypothetical protein
VKATLPLFTSLVQQYNDLVFSVDPKLRICLAWLAPSCHVFVHVLKANVLPPEPLEWMLLAMQAVAVQRREWQGQGSQTSQRRVLLSNQLLQAVPRLPLLGMCLLALVAMLIARTTSSNIASLVSMLVSDQLNNILMCLALPEALGCALTNQWDYNFAIFLLLALYCQAYSSINLYIRAGYHSINNAVVVTPHWRLDPDLSVYAVFSTYEDFLIRPAAKYLQG